MYPYTNKYKSQRSVHIVKQLLVLTSTPRLIPLPLLIILLVDLLNPLKLIRKLDHLLPEHLKQTNLLVDTLLHESQVLAGADCIAVALEVGDQAHFGLQAVQGRAEGLGMAGDQVVLLVVQVLVEFLVGALLGLGVLVA